MDLANLTGPRLKALRRKAGINQTRMASMIGTSRHAISYWETKSKPFRRYELRYGKPAQMLKALGFNLPDYSTDTCAHADGVLDWQNWQQGVIERERARLIARTRKKAARHRQVCGARTRKGHPCRLMSEPGRTRCKFHGGKSTGPRTPEGKARIAEAQRKRWAKPLQ